MDEHWPQIFPPWNVLGIFVPVESFELKIVKFLRSYESPQAIVKPEILRKSKPQINWPMPNNVVLKLQ